MEPYFAFESSLWAMTRGAQLRLNRLERFRDQPVLSPGPRGAPDDHRVESTNVWRTGDRFTMWYVGMRPPPKNVWHMEGRFSVCVAYSDDGLTWHRPDLGLSKRHQRGRWPNNVLPDLGGYAYDCGVRPDGDRYLLQLAHPRGLDVEEGQTTFSIYTSDDGLRWRRVGRNCTDTQHFESTNDIFKWKGWYYVLGQGVSPYYSLPGHESIGRVMFAYRSRDLRTWQRVRKPAYHYPIPRHFPRSSLQVHVGANAWPRQRIVLGFMGQFWPAGFSELVGATIGLVYSYDGKTWSEPFPGEPLLMPQPEAWDRGMLLQGNGVYQKGRHTWYWYAGLDNGNVWQAGGGVGVCRIRRDGFAHWQAAGSRTAMLRTVPIQTRGAAPHLYVNVRASAAHPVRLTLSWPNTSRRPRKITLSRDHVLLHAAELPGGRQSLVLQFELTGSARLYGFHLSKDRISDEALQAWSES